MASKRAVQDWSDQVHTDILCVMADSINLTKPQWAATITALHAKGYTFSESALK